MRANDGTRTAAEVLIDQLVIHGVRHAFCVPGELHRRARCVPRPRHRGHRVPAGERGGNHGGSPGQGDRAGPASALSRRGRRHQRTGGRAHRAPGSTPLILFVGQISREMREREAFQELDYRAVFGSIAKWATEIDDPARVPELVSRAFYAATSGRPGPVVMALPEDMLVERVAVPDAPAFEPVENLARRQRHEPPAEALGRPSVRSCCSAAAAGRSGLRLGRALRRALRAAGRHHVSPRASVRSGASLLRRRSRHRAQSQAARPREGGRPHPARRRPARRDAVAELHAARHSGARARHWCVFPGVEELGRVYRAHLAINAAPTAFAAALEGLQPPNALPWQGEAAAARAAFLAWTEQATAVPGAVNLGEIIVGLRDKPRRRGDLQRRRQFLHLGASLLALPPLRQPARADLGLHGLRGAGRHRHEAPGAAAHVVAFAGDGDFLMTGQEFATAVQYDLPIIVVVVDNAMYGTIRMHQERHYPGRVIATGLKNPDFAAYARAFGGYGATVEKTADFLPAFAAAQQSGKPRSCISRSIPRRSRRPCRSPPPARRRRRSAPETRKPHASGTQRRHVR